MKYDFSVFIPPTREYNRYNKPVKRYHSFEYKVNSWTYPERVVVKAEVNSMGTNIRFIVSSLKNICDRRSKANQKKTKFGRRRLAYKMLTG
jgi:hypothetical protein